MKSLLLFIILTLLSLTATGQSRSDLEKKRSRLNKQIKHTNQLISKTSSTRKATTKKLQVLQRKFGSSEQAIENLALQLNIVNHKIDRKISVIEALEEDLTRLKANYKKLIRQLYRYQLTRNSFSFIFTAPSLSDAYQRWVYLSKLEAYRKIQAQHIQQTQTSLTKWLNELEEYKGTQLGLLESANSQKHALSKEIKAKSEAIDYLKKKEHNLRANLKRKTRYKTQLSKKIEEAIRLQIAAAKRAARAYQQRKTKASKGKKPILNSVSPSSLASRNFAQQKGKLSSPVASGIIVGRYGRRQHARFKDVTINNNGIDIKGNANSVVKNIHNGTVVSIFTIPGFNNAVMIKHGDYYTTYSNITKVYVKQGATLKKGASIGTIGRDSHSGSHILHFEIWHNKSKENPEHWLKKQSGGRL